MNRIINKINELLLEKEEVVVVIDGMCASGKTTFANELRKVFDCNVVHMDDFFLPINLRSEERLKEIGGNVDYVRFKEDVLNNLKGNIFYYKYDCSIGDFNVFVSLEKKKLTVIEGSYAMHPYFNKYYDYSIFFEIDKCEQLLRIEKRNGKEKVKCFKDKWIPLENEYFDYYEIRKKVDLVIDTTNNKNH